MTGKVLLFGEYYKEQMGMACLLKSGGMELQAVKDVTQLAAYLEQEDGKLVLFHLSVGEQKRSGDMETLSVLRGLTNKPVIGIGDGMEDRTRILALNYGADDCVDTNCNPLELLARIYAQIRCYERLVREEKKSVICLEGLEVDDQAKLVRVEGHLVDLTPTEYKILHLLLEEPGRVFSNKQIYERIWKMSPIGADNTIAVHVRHIREKIERNPQEPRYLRVVWGQGYKIG